MTEPPPPELAELFAAEQVAPAASQAARIALRARIARSVAHLPLGAGAAVGVGKILAILAVVVGAGAGTYAVVRQHGRPVPVAAVVTQSSVPSPALPVAAAVEPVAPPTVTPPVVEPIARKPLPPEPPPAAVLDATARVPSPSEATLLAQAWSALGSSDAARALELSLRDKQLHPEGTLREEREALEIVALAKLQRESEARAAASTFYERYPKSVHRALITRSLKPP